MSSFDSTKQSLGMVLDSIVEGKIQLPDFQPTTRGGGQNRVGNFSGDRRPITGDDYVGRWVLRSPRIP